MFGNNGDPKYLWWDSFQVDVILHVYHTSPLLYVEATSGLLFPSGLSLDVASFWPTTLTYRSKFAPNSSGYLLAIVILLTWSQDPFVNRKYPCFFKIDSWFLVLDIWSWWSSSNSYCCFP
jgi:hypothetical protein